MKCLVANLLLVVVLLVNYSDAKVFGRCEFVNTLRRFGFPEHQIPIWTCIANFESHFDTNALNTQTWDHGIFQISQLYWCSPNWFAGGGCQAKCSDFHNDDITDDVRCVRTIFNEHQRLSGNGFNAWTTYRAYCNGDVSSWTRGC